MTLAIETTYSGPGSLEAAAARAVRLIPPLWPLASSVAVNPFLGHTADTLAVAGERLSRAAGMKVTMPRSWYRARIADGTITDADLAAALDACRDAGRPAVLAALKAAVARDPAEPQALPTVTALAAANGAVDWEGVVADRIGAWAAAHFDEGQALWAAPDSKQAWEAWRTWAMNDLTPEIHGLTGFARRVADAPACPQAAIARATCTLGLEPAACESYFHALLLSLGGWSQFARYRLWQAELAGGSDDTLRDLLAIRLMWEEVLFLHCRTGIEADWAAIVRQHAAPLRPGEALIIDAILQGASELAAQREIAAVLAVRPAGQSSSVEKRPRLQAAFCIDVRSEVFRRALESLDPSIRTIGFAGFFGIFTSHRRLASDVEELRLPVLLNPTAHSCSGGHAPADEAKDRAARYGARAVRAWGRFKLAAVSSFAFVEAMGPVYVWKLLRDAFMLQGKGAPDDPMPRFDPGLDLATRIGAADMILRAMSLTSGFARLVLLAGHGANVVNNPHASSLHCGACGGYSGEVNARLLAALLNDAEVRDGLRARGIDIPADTLFLAALHDTTTDAVTLYDRDVEAGQHLQDLAALRGWLAQAGEIARTERAQRLPRASGAADIPVRARDWSEVRPEWALAGCKAFIAAPRARTTGRDLAGRAFLHDYDWRLDEARGFPVLELILTAPVVVASWISLQYYGSAVAPDTFGGGNKLLHNAVGGIGVLEGNGGVLRAGLPWQSVHDGDGLAHEPLRLTVIIEAPVEAMTHILEKHPQVRELFDNGWLHLIAIDATGRITARYDHALQWTHSATEVLAAA